MQATGARDLAVAVIDDGRVLTTAAYGERNADGDPLQPETVMYGASLTKTVFAHLVLQLVDAGVLALDTPIDRLLAQPLPDHPAERGYADWSALADDPRWRSITPRMLLTHSPGFANFGRLEPDGRLRIHFTPGSRYAYSGDGYILLQFVLERGLGLAPMEADAEERAARTAGQTGMRHGRRRARGRRGSVPARAPRASAADAVFRPQRTGAGSRRSGPASRWPHRRRAGAPGRAA